jgi:hypothetical protein
VTISTHQNCSKLAIILTIFQLIRSLPSSPSLSVVAASLHDMRSSLFLSTWAFALATAGPLNRKACTITHSSGFNGGKNGANSGPYSYQFNDTYGSWTRGYSVYVPKDYPSTLGTKEWPVIFDFHGANQDAKKQWQNSQYSLSDEVFMLGWCPVLGLVQR